MAHLRILRESFNLKSTQSSHWENRSFNIFGRIELECSKNYCYYCLLEFSGKYIGQGVEMAVSEPTLKYYEKNDLDHAIEKVAHQEKEPTSQIFIKSS